MQEVGTKLCKCSTVLAVSLASLVRGFPPGGSAGDALSTLSRRRNRTGHVEGPVQCVWVAEGMLMPSRSVLGLQGSRGLGFVPVEGVCVSFSS